MRIISQPLRRHLRLGRFRRQFVSMVVPDGWAVGDALVATSLPSEPCGPQDVRIRVVAAGVNRPDMVQALGRYPPPKGSSSVLGLEVAGIVSEVGQEARSGGTAVGSAVMALTNGGGYAEEVVVPASQCLAIPQAASIEAATTRVDIESLNRAERRLASLERTVLRESPDRSQWPAAADFLAAAVLPEAALTVWANIFAEQRPLAGQVVLVHGGAGGIGAAAISMCRHAGAVVVATATGESKTALCAELGADAVIDYKLASFGKVFQVPEFQAGIQALSRARSHAKDVAPWSHEGQTAHRQPCFEGKADQILDIIGAAYLEDNLRCLGSRGRLSIIAMQSGSRATLDMMRVMLKRIEITGSTLRSRTPRDKAALVQSLAASQLLRACTSQRAPGGACAAAGPAEPAAAEAQARLAEAVASLSGVCTGRHRCSELTPLPAIRKVLPLSQAGAALEWLDRPDTFGRCVLVPDA